MWENLRSGSVLWCGWNERWWVYTLAHFVSGKKKCLRDMIEVRQDKSTVFLAALILSNFMALRLFISFQLCSSHSLLSIFFCVVFQSNLFTLLLYFEQYQLNHCTFLLIVPQFHFFQLYSLLYLYIYWISNSLVCLVIFFLFSLNFTVWSIDPTKLHCWIVRNFYNSLASLVTDFLRHGHRRRFDVFFGPSRSHGLEILFLKTHTYFIGKEKIIKLLVHLKI